MADVTGFTPPDIDYTLAQERFKAALESSGGVGSHVRRGADARPLKVESVYITGDPREIIGAAAKPNDRLDIEVKIPGLRGLKEGQVQEKILQALESQFATVQTADGKKLSGSFDFSRKKTEVSQGIRPQIFNDTSPDDKLKGRDILHILIALPPGVSHSEVVAALSSRPPEIETAAAKAPVSSVGSEDKPDLESKSPLFSAVKGVALGAAVGAAFTLAYTAIPAVRRSLGTPEYGEALKKMLPFVAGGSGAAIGLLEGTKTLDNNELKDKIRPYVEKLEADKSRSADPALNGR